MSGFDVKSSLRKAIVIEDFFYAVSKEIFGYLSENLLCESRICRHIKTMENLLLNNNETPIKNCMKLHMFTYFPDGSIQVKEKSLLSPEFSNDPIENVDYLFDSDFEDNVLHHDILFDLLIPGSAIPLYSPANARELFFLCKVIGVCCHADSNITD